LSPVKIVEGVAELLGGERGELGPVDIVIVDPLVTQRDHLPYNLYSGSGSYLLDPVDHGICFYVYGSYVLFPSVAFKKKEKGFLFNFFWYLPSKY
jgi:hypothetical protein